MKKRNIYIAIIGFLGLILFIQALTNFPDSRLDVLLLLLLLSVLGQVLSVQITSSSIFSVAISIEPSVAISLAAGVIFADPSVSAFVAIVSYVTLTLINFRGASPKSQSEYLARIVFNSANGAISSWVASGFIIFLLPRLGDGLLPLTFIWIVGSFIGEQVNFTFLTVLFYVQNADLSIADAWRNYRVPILFNSAVAAFGGSLIVYSLGEYGLAGILCVAFSIYFSMYAHYLYTSSLHRQMMTLNELVDLHTSTLRESNDRLMALHKEKNARMLLVAGEMREYLLRIKSSAESLTGDFVPLGQRRPLLKDMLAATDITLVAINSILNTESEKHTAKAIAMADTASVGAASDEATFDSQVFQNAADDAALPEEDDTSTEVIGDVSTPDPASQ